MVKTAHQLGQTRALQTLGLQEKDASWGALATKGLQYAGKGLNSIWNWGSKMLSGGSAKSTALVPRTPGMPPMPGASFGQKAMGWAQANPHAATAGIGAGIGGVTGAASSPGDRMGGFMRGAAGGAALGYGGARLGMRTGAGAINRAGAFGPTGITQAGQALGRAHVAGGLGIGAVAGGAALGGGFNSPPPPPAPPANPVNRDPWGGQQNAGGMSGSFGGKF